jgi:hypothetical protein
VQAKAYLEITNNKKKLLFVYKYVDEKKKERERESK